MKIRVFKELQEYQTTLDKMECLVEDIINEKSEQKFKEEIWFLQHPALYTAGTSAEKKDLLSDELPVFDVGRGGQYTYHGPGQRVVYFMLDLKKHYPKPDLRQFVKDLENWVIKSLSEIGIEAFIREGRIGIWVKDKNSIGGESKIGAIGIRVRKWTSFHGVAININPDLNHFKGIVPCGIQEFGVTSLKKLNKSISMAEFDKILIKNIPFIQDEKK